MTAPRDIRAPTGCAPRSTPRRACARRHQAGSSLLEAVVALGLAALLLGGAAEQGLQSSRALADARAFGRALSSGRNVLDRALAAPCAPSGYATTVCVAPLRCTLAAEPIGQRAGASGSVSITRLSVEVLAHEEGREDRSLVKLVSVGTRPEPCG